MRIRLRATQHCDSRANCADRALVHSQSCSAQSALINTNSHSFFISIKPNPFASSIYRFCCQWSSLRILSTEANSQFCMQIASISDPIRFDCDMYVVCWHIALCRVYYYTDNNRDDILDFASVRFVCSKGQWKKYSDRIDFNWRRRRCNLYSN